jgi:hypothetical protein
MINGDRVQALNVKEVQMPPKKRVKNRRGAIGLRGIPGPPGPAGAVGATGPRGEIGSRGAEGPRGSKGLTGEAGAIGPMGGAATLKDVAKQVQYIDRSIENIYNEMGVHISRMSELQKDLDSLREIVRRLANTTGLRAKSGLPKTLSRSTE